MFETIRINSLPGCEGVMDIYTVDKSGNVYSEHLKDFIKPRIKENGYLHFQLKLDGIRKWKGMYAHRLVALAFIDNPNNLPVVNHKDETQDNNNVDNLEWCDHSYNVNYGTAIARGKITSNKNPLKVYDVSGKKVEEGLSMCDTSRKYLGYKDTRIINTYSKGYFFSDVELSFDDMNEILKKSKRKPIVLVDTLENKEFVFKDMKTLSDVFMGKVNFTDAINKKRTVRKRFKAEYHQLDRKNSPNLYKEGSIRIEG